MPWKELWTEREETNDMAFPSVPESKRQGYEATQVQPRQLRGRTPMTVEINSANTVAVDREYYWQPMDTCPRGVKVQLLGAGGVAVYGQYHGKDPWWTHWAPLPVKPKEQ